MTTKFLEGWDYFPTGGYTTDEVLALLRADGYWGALNFGGELGMYPTVGRFGLGTCMVMGGPPGGFDAYRPLNWVFNDGFVWGMAINPSQNVQEKWIYLRNSAAEADVFRIEVPGASAAGILRFIGPWGTARTRTGTVKAGTWAYLQIKSIDGLFEVKINGDIVIQLSGAAQTPQFDTIRFRGGFNSGSLGIDDIYMNDPVHGTTNHDYLGNVRVACQIPIGAGLQTDLTPFGGAFNWQIASDWRIGVNKYNYTPDVGDYDLYELQHNVAARDIFAVGVKGFYMQDNGVQLFGQNQLQIDGGSLLQGSPVGLNQDNYGSIVDYWDRNPDTNDFWTETELNAIQIGPKLESSD